MATKQLPGLTTILPADSIDSTADLMLVRDTSTGADVKVKVGTVVGRDHGTAAGQVPLNSDLGTAATKNIGSAAGQVPLNSDLGTAATKNIGTANGDVPLNSYRTGEVFYHAGSTAPAGAMKANGAAVSRTTYAALFAAIGTVFGAGDGSTTFKLPDLRGEFVRGWDDGRGINSGRALGSLENDAMQGHKHQGYGNNNANVGVNGNRLGDTATNTTTSVAFIGNPTTDGTNGTPRTADETRPRNIALLACIKY